MVRPHPKNRNSWTHRKKQVENEEEEESEPYLSKLKKLLTCQYFTWGSFRQALLPPAFFLPEILATMGYIFYTCMCPDFGPYLGGLNTGMTVYMLVVLNHTIAPVHFNPALSICFLVTGKLKKLELCWYLLAQLIGGLMGSGFTYLIYWLSYNDGFLVVPNLETNANASISSTEIFHEIVATYALDTPKNANWIAVLLSEIWTSSMMCLLAAMTIYNRNTWAESTGILSIGVIVWMGIIAGQKVGAGCLNPIRSDMPWMFFNFEKLRQNWTYNVGPAVGGVLGAFFYGILYCEDESVNFRRKSVALVRRMSKVLTGMPSYQLTVDD